MENGDTWGRFSFVGRDPSVVLVARNGVIEVDGRLPAGVPLDRGVLAALEGLLAVYRSPVLPELPPLHGGVVGFLGYDVVREVERLPAPPPDDLGLPDAVLSVIGHVAAFDHWRQRVSLIENVETLAGRLADLMRGIQCRWQVAGGRWQKMQKSALILFCLSCHPPPATCPLSFTRSFQRRRGRR